MQNYSDLLKHATINGAIDLQKIEEAPIVGYNGSSCDVLFGFCSCGAHHKEGDNNDLVGRKLTTYGQGLLRNYKAKDLFEDETCPLPPMPPGISLNLPNRRAAIEATREKIEKSNES